MKKLFALALVVGCGTSADPASTPPDGFAEAVATPECAPFDGPATSIYLAAEVIELEGAAPGEIPAPHVRVSIYRDVDDLAGDRFEVDGSTVADATRCTTEGECESAVRGVVRIDEAARGDGVSGDVDLQFPAGVVAGSFEARWQEPTFQILCG